MLSVHLDTEEIQRLLHGELAASEESTLREHVAGCVSCQKRITESDAEDKEVQSLLRQLDHPLPSVDAAMVVSAARAKRVGWLRWAAGIVLAVGAVGGAYAAPGSPLPGLVQEIANRVAGTRSPAIAETPPAPSTAAAGIAVLPGQHFVIAFSSPQLDARATVVLTNGSEVVVRALDGGATFTSDADRLVIDNQRSSTNFEIEIPRNAPAVEIFVGERRVFLKQGSRVTAEASTDSLGTFELPLAPVDPMN